MIAPRAGRHEVFPGVLAVEMPGEDMVDGQDRGLLSAILTGIMVTSEDFTPGEVYHSARTPDLVVQTNNRWDREGCLGSFEGSPSIEDEGGFFGEHQPDGSFVSAHVDRLKVCVQHQYGFIHIILVNYSARIWWKKKGD